VTGFRALNEKMNVMLDPSLASTFLFVPADRPERFEKAVNSGADAVIIDLEDAVAPANRPAARAQVVAWLRSGGEAVIRVNARGTADHDADVGALRGLAKTVMLAKTESADDADSTASAVGPGTRVIALIETARGILAASDIARAAAVSRLAFGNVDLGVELGVDAANRTGLLTARSLVNLASAAAGLSGPIDGVTTIFDDETVVGDDAAYAASLGFRGKLCIHPRQVAPVASGFRPTETEIAWAASILASGDGGEARTVDGAMVDRPVLERARQIAHRAGIAEQP
jgi:citrate lyase subunit beta/citryl-CoA lyase